MIILSKIAIFFIRIYRQFVSPFKVPCCRFSPTCSQYAVEALKIHGFFKGSLLICKRILKCHPWGDCGYDPVPLKKTKTKEVLNEKK